MRGGKGGKLVTKIKGCLSCLSLSVSPELFFCFGRHSTTCKNMTPKSQYVCFSKFFLLKSFTEKRCPKWKWGKVNGARSRGRVDARTEKVIKVNKVSRKQVSSVGRKARSSQVERFSALATVAAAVTTVCLLPPSSSSFQHTSTCNFTYTHTAHISAS